MDNHDDLRDFASGNVAKLMASLKPLHTAVNQCVAEVVSGQIGDVWMIEADKAAVELLLAIDRFIAATDLTDKVTT